MNGASSEGTPKAVSQSVSDSSLITTAIPTKQETVSVPIPVLKRAIDEASISNQMTKTGGFLLTGGTWLGLERLVTEVYIKDAGFFEYNWLDPLFVPCAIFVVLGCVIYYWGHKIGKLGNSGLNDFLPKAAD